MSYQITNLHVNANWAFLDTLVDAIGSEQSYHKGARFCLEAGE